MKKDILSRIGVCLLISIFIIVAGSADNAQVNTDSYSTTPRIFNDIGATLFLTVVFFVMSLIFVPVKKKSS